MGVNKYRPTKEERVEILAIDNTAVRTTQLEKLAKVKASRDAAKVKAALETLRRAALETTSTSAGAHPLNLLAVTVEAARVRCTLGEIS